MKKAIGQTVRDLKREVNKKVLKVPGIEQKVLDATSNEPWGPHGTHLADIAQATRNYHEYQMIMSVIWKRINDTGKNWRHVYKALTVLEYLVGHGSERVIDEIREHIYQISTLSDFQYIDSSGRDQGSNVRKKSQSLVALVNDKERIQEVRQKAAANRDKFRNTNSAGGMYRPSSYSSSGGYGDRYDDDRCEGRYGRDEDRNGYGREREWGSRDDDRYGRNGDSYGPEGDRYGRDSDERYGRDGYKDDDYRGRSRSNEDYQYGSRSRSADRDRDRAFDEESNHSSRGGARTDEHPQYGRQLERKFSEQNLDAPPSYEEAVADAHSPVHDERDGATPAAPAPKTSSPPVSTSPSQATTAVGPSTSPPANKEVDAFDEFDPRGPVSAVPATSISPEMDLLGSLSESFSSNSLALVPSGPATTTSEAAVLGNAGSAPASAAMPSGSAVMSQSFEDPFGDSPFRALPSAESVPAQPQDSASTTSFQTMNQTSGPPFPVTQGVDTGSNFDFGDTFPGITYTPSGVSTAQPPSASPQFSPQEQWIPQQNNDILADILPPSGSSAPAISQAAFPAPTGQSVQPNPNVVGGFLAQSGSADHAASQFSPQIPTGPAAQYNNGNFLSQLGSAAPVPSQAPLQGPVPSQSPFQAPVPSQSPFQAPVSSQSPFQAPVSSQSPFQAPVPSQSPFQAPGPSQSPFQAPVPSQAPFQAPGPSQAPFQAPGPSQAPFQSPSGPATHPSNDNLGGLFPQAGLPGSVMSQSTPPASTGSLAIVPQASKDKFETKSTVWADTLSRGLVNLNISGAKINPLADIGIDFDAINRKEKRMEKPKPATTAPVSTTTMGKAMGSGSGMGRAGAGALRPPPNTMMGSGMGMGMGMGSGPGAGMSMGMGGGPGSGMGMGMGGAPGVGMGMGMGMGGAPAAAGMGMGMGGGVGMGGYGGMNQPMGMGMNVGMGMNMGMGQGAQMQQPTGLPPGGYNPMMGSGGYAPQQPYGGGYR